MTLRTKDARDLPQSSEKASEENDCGRSLGAMVTGKEVGPVGAERRYT